jgi:23S rRNA (cytidine2498-2'-O)-methyltransferase
MIQSAYLAKKDLLEPLLQELADPQAIIKDQLVLSTKPYKKLFFVQNAWPTVETIPISSIQDGIRKLKQLYPFWAFYSTGFHRRGELILDGLRKIKQEPVDYLSPLPKHKVGGFTLLDQDTILACKNPLSYYPHGEVLLKEDKHPPSRAYLKIIEALHLVQKYPTKEQKCLELGASPGSWTYILAQICGSVIACDRSELDPKLSVFKNITFIKGDAFKLTPDKVGPIDWLFSDIICYPEKLLSFIQEWIKSGFCKNFICTIKFQGPIDLEIVKKFEQIENSFILHLYHNKHELTFFLLNSSF